MFRSLPAATYGATDAESRLALMALYHDSLITTCRAIRAFRWT
jgi:hypothetical protein